VSSGQRHTEPVDVHLILRRDTDGGPEVLLSRRAGDVYASGLLHLPSGHLDGPHEDVVGGVIREAEEEAGIVIDRADVRAAVTVHHRSPAGGARVGFFFEVTRWQGTPSIKESGLCSEMSWRRLATLPTDMVAYCWAGLEAYRQGARVALHFQQPGDPIEYRPGAEERLTLLPDASRGDELDDAVRSFAEHTVGRLARVTDASWARDISRVWRIEADHGGIWYLKVHQNERFHRHEVNAYRAWVPVLGDRAPRLVAADGDLRAIIFTEWAGRSLLGLTLRRETEQEVHRQLGELTACFHAAAPAITASLPKPSKVERHLEAARPYLADGDEELVKELAARRTALPADVLWVPTLGDLQLRNALLDGDEPNIHVGLIDYERAEYGPPVRDFARLSDAWDGRPDLARSFFSGYGRELSPAEVARLACEAGLDAVSGVGYGAAHHDPELVERGLRTLRRLRTSTFL
jgi:Ser/Thr protein kinase RdoA (MazF antagonist)/8-oxo-dGTP pyrophosphatase MutT (NUDIX family)